MKLMTPFTAAGHKFLIRIDLNEIAAYMPLLVSDGTLEDAGGGTTVFLKSGETMAVQESPEQLDKLFADKEIVFNLNK